MSFVRFKPRPPPPKFIKLKKITFFDIEPIQAVIIKVFNTDISNYNKISKILNNENLSLFSVLLLEGIFFYNFRSNWFNVN